MPNLNPTPVTSTTLSNRIPTECSVEPFLPSNLNPVTSLPFSNHIPTARCKSCLTINPHHVSHQPQHPKQTLLPESRGRQPFGRSVGKWGSMRGRNPFYRKKGFLPLITIFKAEKSPVATISLKLL